MTCLIENHTQTRKDSFDSLKRHIERFKLPFIFDGAIYKSDGEPINIKCMFGHHMKVKPYEIKDPYHDRPAKSLPQCWECLKAGTGAVELRHRVDIHYNSGKKIQVLSPYKGPRQPVEYMIEGRRHMSSPNKMGYHIRNNPGVYVVK